MYAHHNKRLSALVSNSNSNYPIKTNVPQRRSAFKPRAVNNRNLVSPGNTLQQQIKIQELPDLEYKEVLSLF